MDTLKHWTNRSIDDFVHAVAFDFVAQIEAMMEEQHMDRKSLAMNAHVSPGRISQVLNKPSSLNLRTIVKYTRAMKKKVAIVTYDDGDTSNQSGPIDAGVFSAAWHRLGCPHDLFEVCGVSGADSKETGIAQGQYQEEGAASHAFTWESDGGEVNQRPQDVVWQNPSSTISINQKVINAQSD